MEIVPYQHNMTNELTECFNELVKGVPHRRPLTTDEMHLAISGNNRRKNRRIHPERTFVAIANGEIQGFALAAQQLSGTLQNKESGIIRFLGYQRGNGTAGKVLLDAAESHLENCKVKEITAFSRSFPFTICHSLGGLSNHQTHIQGLLTARGYERIRGHVTLEWREFSVEDVPATCPLEFVYEETSTQEGLPDFLVTAYLNGQPVGECFCRPFQTSQKEKDAGPWLSVNDLDIVDGLRGKGYGWLTLQRALLMARKIGYRSAIIGANETNGPALSLYSNIGFKPIDWIYGFTVKRHNT